MKTKTNNFLGWKQIYIVLIALILMSILLRHSRRGPSRPPVSSSQDLFTESSLSAQNQFTEPSPSPSPSPSSEDQFIESSSSAENQFTESSPTPSGEAQLMESSSVGGDQFRDPSPSAQDLSSPLCNYAKGRWVADGRSRFYSGFGCKRWLPSPWACRLTKREDFSYEGYRWQPMNCEMPEFGRFAFLRKMQNKTIAFMGDSLGRQQFHSLMCMATGGEDSPEVKDVGKEYGLVRRSGAARPDGWAYWFPTTNTTILFYWSSTLCKLERINNTDPDSSFALHLDRVPTFLSKFLHRFDVLVLNTANHWIKAKFMANRWTMYVNGKPVKDGMLMDMMNVKNFTVHRVVKWLDSQLPLHPGLKAFFRTRSPRHLDDTGNCNNTTPLTGGSEVLQEGSSDTVVETAIQGTRVNILDITALSALRDEAHKSQYRIFGTSPYYDCLHWCLPGIPDTWNELLAAQLS